MPIEQNHIRTAIEYIKGLTSEEYTDFVMNFAHHYPHVSRFINGGHYRIINRTERDCLNYYIFVAHKALQEVYPPAVHITEQDMKLKKEKYFVPEVMEQTMTPNPNWNNT